MALTRVLVVLSVKNLPPPLLTGLGTAADFSVKAKENVRAKCAPVNSIFLVQLRKKVASDSFTLGCMKQRLREVAWMPKTAEFLLQGESGRRNLPEWAAILSTERAQEMQKDSGQWSVVSLVEVIV